MEIKLPQIVKKRKKRVGRGYGSGKGGHTSGRGQKGQKARRNMNILFEGVKMKKSLLRRLPQLRGKGKFKPKKKITTIGTGLLNILPEGEVVNISNLLKFGILKKRVDSSSIKIVKKGKLDKKLILALKASKAALKEFVKISRNKGRSPQRAKNGKNSF